jgi:hypothetical protein
VPARAAVLSARWAALLAALFLAAPPSLSAQDASPVELLLELRIDRGPTADIFALQTAEGLLLSVQTFLDLAEIEVDSISPGRRLQGKIEPEGLPFLIDSDSGVARSGDLRIPLDSGAIAWLDGQLFASTTLLERMFSVRLSPSLSELVVAVRQVDHLPVVRRMERERRRRWFATDSAFNGVEMAPPRRRPVDGVVFDWAVSGATDDPFDASTVDLGLGAQLLGGSGLLRYTERRFGGETDRTPTGSWTRVWHTTPWVRQVRLGEALGSGSRPRIVRGAVVTNAPFVRPAAFAVNPLEGILAPGWEVELYRGMEYIDYARTGPDGRYLFDVPVLYGENPLEIVAYGPNGQVLRERRTFEVAAERLPAGQFEYGVGGGACVYDLCAATLNVDLRYGIDRRWTVRGGVDRFWRDTLPDLWHPYGSVTFQATRSIALFAEGVGNAQVAGRAEYAPTQDLRVTLAQTWFTGNVTLPLIGSEFEDSRSEASLYVRPAWLDYRTFGRLFAVRSRGANVDRDLVGAVATVRFNGARLDVGGTHERRRLTDLPATDRTTVDMRLFQIYGGSVPWLRRTLFRAELRADVDSGPVLGRVGFNRGFGNVVQLDMGVGWQRGLGATFEVGITATLRPVRMVSRNRVSPEGTRGIQSVEGSLIWESSTSRVEFADGRSLGRAGIVGEVFVDANGNGIADPGETRVPNVSVRVGPIAARTDAEGRFAVWDLMPFEPLVLEVDANSVRDPLWVPATPRLLVRPDPNTFTRIPVPLVQAGEVNGRVLLGEDGAGLRGVQVELRNQDTGDVYSTATFSDGSFYVMGVRPGRYVATVVERVQELLSLSVQPAEFEVLPTSDGAIVEGVIIRADRR